MKKYWPYIVLTLLVLFIVFSRIFPAGMSKADRQEIKRLTKEIEESKTEIRNLRIQKSEEYSKIIEGFEKQNKLIADSNEIREKFKKLRSNPITNPVGDSIARAIIKKAAIKGQH